MQGVDPAMMPEASVIIASLMHDLCKADALRYNVLARRAYKVKKTHGHSARSLRQVGYSGFVLTPEETDAILWHMGGKKLTHGSDIQKKLQRDQHLAENPLSYLVFHADKRSIGEAKTRHHSHRNA